MAKLMKLIELMAIAAAAGITLESEEIETANLYVMVDAEENNLYVGKAASKYRHLAEDAFKSLEYERIISFGFVALVAENDARRRALRYEPERFDSSQMYAHIDSERWSGPAIDRLVNRLNTQVPPTVEEVEQILIRIHVCTGRLIGNSQFASQWEGPAGSFVDTVSVLAAEAARISGALPRRTVISKGDIDATEGSERTGIAGSDTAPPSEPN